MRREPGQVWRWYTGAGDEHYHCMLLRFQDMNEAAQEMWDILDLDTDNAGRQATAYVYDDVRANARRERIA